MRLIGTAGLLALVVVPVVAQVPHGGPPTKQPAAVAPLGVDKNSLYPETEYISGHQGSTEKQMGQLVITATGVAFFDNKGRQVFALPINTLRSAEHTRDVRDPSVGKKLLFGALAGDRKQDFLTLTTETESDAEGVVFKVKQNVATGIAAKINFYVRKAHEDTPGAEQKELVVIAAHSEPIPPPSGTPAVHAGPLSATDSASGTAVPASSTLRSNDELGQTTGFRLAAGDARRVGLVTGYREIGPDTLAVDLSDLAMSSTSTEPQLGRLFAAYVRITSFSKGSTFLLQHGGQSVGEYTSTGLARGDWR
jgi:hypothetical protein